MDPVSHDFDAVWADFCDRTHTLGPSPGARSAWHRGRRTYAVWVLRVTCPTLVADVAARQARLGPLIAPVARDRLHVTVWVLGFPTAQPALDDDVDQQDLDRTVAALQDDPPAAARVRVDPIGSFASAAMLPVHDADGGLVRVRRRLSALPEQRFGPYRPHITLGTYTDDHPVDRVLRALQPQPQRAPLSAVLDTLDLVHIDAWDPETPWQIAARIPLEAPCASS